LDLLWEEAKSTGEIPGAYWALMTHPGAKAELVSTAFGDVHMLSHLVGAANRADIRRLNQLEQDKSELESKIERQQSRLRDLVREREALQSQLSQILLDRALAPCPTGIETLEDNERDALRALVLEMRARYELESQRRERAERQLSEQRTALSRAQATLESANRENQALSSEVAVLEAKCTQRLELSDGSAADLDLEGKTVLYVGGRANTMPVLRSFVEESGGQFLHHDGGIEERNGLLAGLIRRSDAVAFPVDCISHSAATLLKRLCLQSGRPFLPLRSASFAGLVIGLRQVSWLSAAIEIDPT
jgi:hypothetical protein